MKKNHLILMLFTLLLILTSCGQKKEHSTTAASESSTTTSSTKSKKVDEIKKSAIPTLFFHGYQGTKGSFGHMLQRMESAGFGTQELILNIAPDGTVTADGALSGEADNPFVQVLFTDNENNEWNQADWVKAALIYLRDTYSISEANIVGHSMGGVSSFRCLTAYGYDTTLPKINKFVAMGAPFNEFIDSTQSAPAQTLDDVLANGPTEVAARFTDFQSGIANVSSQINFLLIGGQLSDTDLSDGTVPLTSAFAIHRMLTANGNPVTCQIIQQTDHSGLHENEDADHAVENFLWK